MTAASPSFIVAVVVIWLNRAQGSRDAIPLLDKRISALEIQLSGTKEWLDKLGEELADIRSNMVRREDLETLSTRIDGALRDALHAHRDRSNRS